MKLMNTLRLVTAAAILGTGFSLPATAHDAEFLSTTVKFGDVDLSRPDGGQVLFDRIRSAAETVCAPFARRDLALTARFKSCVDESVAHAVSAVDRPALTKVYDTKNGITRPTVTLASAKRR